MANTELKRRITNNNKGVKQAMIIKDNTQPTKWSKDLKEDLQRVNKYIKEQREEVDKGIKNLKDLHRSREDILQRALEDNTNEDN